MTFSEPGRDPVASLLVGLLVGATAVAIIWYATSAALGGDEGPTGTTQSTHSTQTAAAGGHRRVNDADTTLSRCKEVDVAQTAPLRTAAASLAQWQIHIGAMNQLVAGTITLRQARRFWAQTRVGAHHRLDEYQQAMARYGSRTARCPRRAEVEGARERRCVSAVASRRAALQAADVAVRSWRRHVHHMEMLRDGRMSPEEATRLWLQSWHRGNQQLRTYGRAARAAEDESCR